ncbi:uncharacterized protein LOC141912752 [Tubulanus polymorphus]|uniref:uncharacterized protein LOC141912752 n=1 Tax=Tubulanus polymorphus TaxID=672921 RepID=UPI003DA3BC9A
MGCSYSRSNGDSNPNLFSVYNVDDQGQELTAGKIEVSDSQLTLFQKNKEPIKWPLRCLRRYGFDAELFSFESGRRCPTGSGIYAFKCRRAEALFNLLQECIHRAGQEEHRYNTSATLTSSSAIRSSSLAESSYVSPTAPAVPIQSPLTAPSDDGELNNDAGHHYINGDVAHGSPQNVLGAGAVTHEYVNSAICSLPRRRSSTDTETADIDMEFDAGSEDVLVDVVTGENGVVNYTMINLPRGGVASVRRSSEEDESSRRDSRESRSTVGQTEPYMNMEMLGIVDTKPEVSSYMNVEAATISNGSTGKQQQQQQQQRKNSGLLLRRALQRQTSLEQHSYANLDLAAPSAGSVISTTARNSLPNTSSSKVNYIQLDLEQHVDVNGATCSGAAPASPSSIVSSPESPSRKVQNGGGSGADSTDSYAMIDFNKTVALSNTSKAASVDEGSRKTRHSSTVSDKYLTIVTAIREGN